MNTSSDSRRWDYDGAFRQESERLLSMRLKIASGIALISIVLFALGDYVIAPSQFVDMLNVRLFQCLTISVFILMLFVLRDFDYLRIGGLLRRLDRLGPGKVEFSRIRAAVLQKLTKRTKMGFVNCLDSKPRGRGL